MTTLVTGAFGCIGSWVARALLADGERPVLLDVGDDPWRLRMIAGPDFTSRLTIVRGDVPDLAGPQRVVGDHGIRRIVHLRASEAPLCRRHHTAGPWSHVLASVNVL